MGLLIISLLITLISITNTAFERLWQSTCEILLRNPSLTGIEFSFLFNLSIRLCDSRTCWGVLWGHQLPRIYSGDHFAKHTVCTELDKNTWQTGSVVDLRLHERTGSPSVKNKTRSSYHGTQGLQENLIGLTRRSNCTYCKTYPLTILSQVFFSFYPVNVDYLSLSWSIIVVGKISPGTNC